MAKSGRGGPADLSASTFVKSSRCLTNSRGCTIDPSDGGITGRRIRGGRGDGTTAGDFDCARIMRRPSNSSGGDSTGSRNR